MDAAAFCAQRDCRAGWRKARERSQASGREMLQRTAKSCGPDARSWRQVCGVASARPGLDKTYSQATVANKPDHRGEHEGNR